MNGFWEVTLALLEGFGTTAAIFALTLAIALPLGLLVAFGSMSRFFPLRALMRFLVWAVRGTPLMLQLIVIFYGPALLFGTAGFDRFTAVIAAFSVNYACYFSEIYRGGIGSVPQGQREAAQTLGLSKMQTFWYILLPQVIKRILAPMSNEVMTLVKDTSLARIISVAEIIMVAQEYSRRGLIWPLFYTGAFYLVFIGGLTLLFRFFERKTDFFKI